VTETIPWEIPSVRRTIPLLILLTCQYVRAQEPAAVPPILVLDSGGHTSSVWKVLFTPDGKELISVSINVATFKYIPPHLRGAAVGLFALLRNEGGSVGTSLAPALEWRREHFHTARVGEFLDPLNPVVNSFLEQGRAFYLQLTGDAAASQQLALQSLENLVEQQATSLAYFDDFWLFGVLALALVPLVFLMKRSVAEKGEHIGAE
jgi:MFS transporter, DHA2 family, multidrug resistance protein